MPKKRQPLAIWKETRRRIWLRDQGQCQFPGGKHPVALVECHIDHIISGKKGSNTDENLRVLCRFHHMLRADLRHRGMIAAALRDGIIPPDWRRYVWDDGDFDVYNGLQSPQAGA